MKILNLYAGLGGNRKLWKNCEVTAIENNFEIAEIYSHFFPQDNLIIADAHQYLLENFNEYDFIWSSPPCQSHNSFRQNICVRFRGTKPVYPDMALYQEIIFLRANYKKLWIVENVKPYYEPLINPSFQLARHLFWSSHIIKTKKFPTSKLRSMNKISDLEKYYNINLSEFKIENKRQILRNCVYPEVGNYIYKNLGQQDKLIQKFFGQT